MRALTAQLERDPSCRLIRIAGQAGSAGGFPRVAVVEMTAAHAAALATSPGIYLEADQPLTRGLTVGPARGRSPIGQTQHLAFEVVDDGMRPIEGAVVSLEGAGFPVTGFTGTDGRVKVTLPLQAIGEATALLVHPPRGCWSVRVNRPHLPPTDPNRPIQVVCTRITTTHPQFPERALDSWGARVMGFDRLPPTYRGHGVRIALIDSGAAAGHPDLAGRLEHGRDIIGQDDKSWQEDLVGTGTHHAVLIAGHDDGTGIVGLAPETQVHICRSTPAGSCADLIEALDYCIEHQIDVALIGIGIPDPSPLLAAKVHEASRNGVACIAAAGDTGGPIWYPAALPEVLAVGAIGQIGTFPPETTDTAELTEHLSPEGFFAAHFTNTGPTLDCCAPGVAVVSGLPPASYGPISGTATAAAHVTAVAALILAHHPLLRPEPGRPPTPRDSTRINRLFHIIRTSCRPIHPLDPPRTGAGIPDAAIAVGAAPWATHPPIPIPYTATTTTTTPYGQPPQTQATTLLQPLTAAMRAANLITTPTDKTTSTRTQPDPG